MTSIFLSVLNRERDQNNNAIFVNLRLERRSLKKKIRASTGFEPVTSANTGAMLYQLSYEATHWERGQFIEFMSSRQ